jgi:D-alanine-D-alanine ligase
LNLPFVYQEVRRLTLAAHVALGCRGVSWCGFPLRRPHRGQKDLFQTEVKPHPGITETSHVPEPARLCAGTTFDEFVQWMVQDAPLDR